MQRLTVTTVALCIAVLVTLPAFGQEAPRVKVRDLMSEDEFKAAGLGKLTKEELAALDGWFSRTAVRILALGTSGPALPPRTTQSLVYSALEGAIIVADDGEFLGKITINSVDAKSITNEVGRYGSSVSRTSIFNEVGRYGGEVARMSPFNPVTSVPPRIFKGNDFVAYLTVNPVKSPRVDPRALVGWLKANEYGRGGPHCLDSFEATLKWRTLVTGRCGLTTGSSGRRSAAAEPAR